MALFFAAAVVIGFARSYFLAGMFRAKLPSLLVHIHGALFVSWIALLIAQVGLVLVGRVRWHMRLGLAGMSIGALMVPIGFATLVAAVRRNFDDPQNTRVIFTVDTIILLFFAILVFWAYMARRDAATHKRLIFAATFIILAPAVARWPFHFMENPVVTLAILDSFLAMLIIYDFWTRKRLHRITIAGILLTAAWQAVYVTVKLRVRGQCNLLDPKVVSSRVRYVSVLRQNRGPVRIR